MAQYQPTVVWVPNTTQMGQMVPGVAVGNPAPAGVSYVQPQPAAGYYSSAGVGQATALKGATVPPGPPNTGVGPPPAAMQQHPAGALQVVGQGVSVTAQQQQEAPPVAYVPTQQRTAPQYVASSQQHPGQYAAGPSLYYTQPESAAQHSRIMNNGQTVMPTPQVQPYPVLGPQQVQSPVPVQSPIMQTKVQSPKVMQPRFIPPAPQPYPAVAMPQPPRAPSQVLFPRLPAPTRNASTAPHHSPVTKPATPTTRGSPVSVAGPAKLTVLEEETREPGTWCMAAWELYHSNH